MDTFLLILGIYMVSFIGFALAYFIGRFIGGAYYESTDKKIRSNFAWIVSLIVGTVLYAIWEVNGSRKEDKIGALIVIVAITIALSLGLQGEKKDSD
jgi:hypothetical protein